MKNQNKPPTTLKGHTWSPVLDLDFGLNFLETRISPGLHWSHFFVWLGGWLLFEISVRKSSSRPKRPLLHRSYDFLVFLLILHSHVTHQALFHLDFVVWAIMFDITELCTDKLPQMEKFNRNLPSIGFEMSLADSVVHLQIPKTWSKGFACFRPHEGESERFAFLHNSHEFSDWRKHFHDGKFEHCECITMPTGVHDNILWETIRNHDEVL